MARAKEYEYLGLTLSRDLTWTEHIDRMCAKARRAAASVTAVATNARPVQPAVIAALVKACILPAFDYGIEYWGVGLFNATAKQRQLQAAVARPLRAALSLPITTHQHSVLSQWGYGIPALAAHIQHKQSLHLRRLARLQASDPDHPTVQLYQWLSTGLRHEHRELLDPKAAGSVPTAVYLFAAFTPHALPADGPAAAAVRAIPSPTAYTARIQAAYEVPNSRRQQPEAFWAELANTRNPAFDTRLRRHRRAASRREWQETHMPRDAAARNAMSISQRNRCTTAPITQCTPAEDDEQHAASAPLHFLQQRLARHLHSSQLTRRARLLYNRSYTGTVRLRFARAEAEANDDSTCSHPECRQEETIEHMLLHCKHYDAAREMLRQALADSGLPLNLHTVLNPPPRGKRAYLELLGATDAFLDSVEATRRRERLPALDACPDAYSTPTPPPLARPEARRAQRQGQRRRHPHTARAAPLPLDTG